MIIFKDLKSQTNRLNVHSVDSGKVLITAISRKFLTCHWLFSYKAYPCAVLSAIKTHPKFEVSEAVQLPWQKKNSLANDS